MHGIINSDNSDIHLMDIHLMIQWFCVTLSLQAGVFKTLGGCLEAALGPYFRILSANSVVCLVPLKYEHVEIVYDINLLIGEYCIIPILLLGILKTRRLHRNNPADQF